VKGSVIALAIDLALRRESRDRRSLDDVMRLLWRRYGKTGSGVPEDGVEEAVLEVLSSATRSLAAARRMRALLRRAVHGTADLPLDVLLRTMGVRFTVRSAASAADRGGFTSSQTTPPARIDLGVRLAAEGEARIVSVLNGSAAHDGGLAAGDVIVAVEGLRVHAKSFDVRIQRATPGQGLRIHFFRRDEMRTTEVAAAPARPDTCELALAPRRRSPSLRRWLRGART